MNLSLACVKYGLEILLGVSILLPRRRIVDMSYVDILQTTASDYLVRWSIFSTVKQVFCVMKYLSGFQRMPCILSIHKGLFLVMGFRVNIQISNCLDKQLRLAKCLGVSKPLFFCSLNKSENNWALIV